MELIIITPEVFIEGEVTLLRNMLANGLRVAHIRKPGSSTGDLRSYLNQFSAEERGCMVLHSCHELVAEFGLRGAHITEADRRADINLILDSEAARVSTALHSEDHLGEVTLTKGGFEYVFLSPVFNSISKPGYTGRFSFQSLQTALRRAVLPVIALGGITADRVGQLRALGFSGVAALGAVWNSSDPLMSFKELRSACQAASAASGALESEEARCRV